jgi:parallel beta-helix repeat protein
MRSFVSALVLFLTLPTPALASDGVLEINRACAVQTGCFAGDTAGFPVTISARGSYRLTSNLALPDENTDGIQISNDNVSIDLAGFEIRGPVVCSGAPLTCVPATGTGSGVASNSSFSGLSVRNGSIRGMGLYGVSLGFQSEVANLRVRENRINGIYVGNGSTVSGNTAHSNGGAGIFVGSGSTVSGNTAYLNGNDGIFAGNGSTVSGNTAYRNEDDGIAVAEGSTVSSNAAYLNGDTGIFTAPGCTVIGNTMRQNTGFGLNAQSQSGYRENVLSNNTGGTVTGLGINAGNNVCDGSLTCP